MRTLVISDLHLGNRAGHDVLALPAVRERLLEALDGIERLVLLGDVMELVSRPRSSVAAAEPVMRALGRRLGPEREVIVVPGNHDAPLARRWALAQGAALAPSTAVDPAASPFLEQLLAWLAPARTRVSYPGVWLGDGIWATHGHYLDRHLIPESAFGLRRRLAADRPGGSLPIDYEHARHRRRHRGSRSSRLLERPAGALLDHAAELVRTVALPVLPRLARGAGLASLTAMTVDTQMRRASIPALADVVRRLGIEADWVLFGHVHRRGPIGAEPWPAAGGTRFLNTGAWLYEPVLIDRATPPHGYWGGPARGGGGGPRVPGGARDGAAATAGPTH